MFQKTRFSRGLLTSVWALAFVARIGWASIEIQRCGSNTDVGSHCKIAILDVRPTQVPVGLREVYDKKGELEILTPKKLKKELEKNPAPAVIGPGGAFYIFDHHHFALALWMVGEEKLILDVQKDWSGETVSNFWSKMKEAHWVYLRDQEGQGPIDPSRDLPLRVTEMKDDPYRSLARGVRDQGGYDKTDEPFADFAWANFLRPRVPLRAGASNKEFGEAVEVSTRRWAHSKEAQGLPGYIPYFLIDLVN